MKFVVCVNMCIYFGVFWIIRTFIELVMWCRSEIAAILCVPSLNFCFRKHRWLFITTRM